MRTDLDFTTLHDDDITDSDLVGYYRPQEIVDDPQLSVSRKKAMLAYWASDIHAVAGVPALRRVWGATVRIDDLMAAMARLDEEIDAAAIYAAQGGGEHRLS